MLLHRDAEAHRLVELERAWRKVKGDESELLRRRKRNLIIGYTFFLIISVGMLFYLLVKLFQSI
jgi:hypothetical protein